ncbi:unnamed protein product [Microthlaspi erraticum]|uniref:Uncharacterized protein n=1 Tax=Microthlaspi erraticum TaxID=1685480 RepID=A0A6D2J4Q5_9BRAS|nr:unnamed protein product [Microthlaspi erraticum]
MGGRSYIGRSEANLIKKGKEVGKVLTIQYDEGREESGKNAKTCHVSLALPWTWFGSVVWLIGPILGLIAVIVHKCASPAMVVLAGQVGSVVAISNRWTDRSL